MKKPFEDIRITGLDALRTEQSPTASGLRLMHLTLSDSPSGEWIEFFDQERSFPRHTMWRRAWIAGTNIVVDCVPEEIERHLGDLKEDVANANRKFIEWAKKQGEEMMRQVEEERKERERIQGIANRLKFD
jgi:hypothetical protein